MHSFKTSSLMRSAAVAAAALFSVSAPALAQNWEAAHQLRAGMFVQGGHTTFNGNDGFASDSRTTGATGFGVTAGAEMLRAGGWTFGLEGDLGQTGATKTSLANLGANAKNNVAGVQYAADYFGSLRGRVGLEVVKNWVLYGTGGIGFRGVSITDGLGDKNERTLYGGVYGGGSEWHIGQSTILFAEYLHNDYHNGQIPLQTQGNTFPPSTTTTNYQISGHSDAFRIGAKFKLGFDNYTDDVRDGLRR